MMISSIKNHVLDWVFPRHCIGCSQADIWLCEQCSQLFTPNSHQQCYVCGETARYGDTCSGCHDSQKLEKLLVGYHYNGNPLLKKSIRTLKYERKSADIIEKLGEKIGKTLNQYLTIPSKELVIVPVPLHRTKRKHRGFNQAALLAKALQKSITPQPILKTLLSRDRNTASQVSQKNRLNRLNNLSGAFSCNRKLPPEKTYLLIDDVATTGTTLEECCRILKEQGAREVWGLVLARN